MLKPQPRALVNGTLFGNTVFVDVIKVIRVALIQLLSLLEEERCWDVHMRGEHSVTDGGRD